MGTVGVMNNVVRLSSTRPADPYTSMVQARQAFVRAFVAWMSEDHPSVDDALTERDATLNALQQLANLMGRA